jgi:hypothetical protein
MARRIQFFIIAAAVPLCAVGCSREQQQPKPTSKQHATGAQEPVSPKKPQRSPSVTGKVSSVTISNSVSFNFVRFEGKDKPGSGTIPTVNLELEGQPSRSFVVPVSKIVAFPGFTDLKGRHESLGGLLILSDLKERLEGKRVELTYEKVDQKEQGELRVVTGIAFPSQ